MNVLVGHRACQPHGWQGSKLFGVFKLSANGSLFSARHPFPRVFSWCNRRELDRYLQSGGGMCLSNMPDTRTLYGGRRCGNGYLEDGEECDCGEEEVSVRARETLFSELKHRKDNMMDHSLVASISYT